MKHNPTPEQAAIIEAARTRKESLLIRAYAGTGKTTTLEMIAYALPSEIPGLALAFNVKIKKELEKRFPPHFTVMTMNGLGHRAWAKAIGKRPVIDERKLGRLVTQVCKEAGFDASPDDWNSIRQLASNAMTQGLIPKEFTHVKGLLADSDESWSILMDELLISNEVLAQLARSVVLLDVREGYTGTISFDDQIYLSTMYNGVFPRFAQVMVDEAQDLSPLNHIQVRRAASDRLIVVGDDKQAIYAFRGADHTSMEKLKSLRSEWIELPLATTFRCPQSVVARQQIHAPGFVAFSKNIVGQVINWREEGKNELKGAWNGQKLLKLANGYEPAILCRNNAPLLSCAFKLIRSGIGCHMVGRDIGKGLIALAKKLIPLDDTPGLECHNLITAWMESEIAIAEANGKDNKAEQIDDKGQCLLAVLDDPSIRNAGDMRQRLELLFDRESGQITLSTGHRAKGLEWPVVLHIDPWRIPSKYAKGKSLRQESNLRYVIETRAMQTLIMANMEDYKDEC